MCKLSLCYWLQSMSSHHITLYRSPNQYHNECNLFITELELNRIIRRIGRLWVQTPLSTWPCFGTQPHYEAPGDHRVKLELMEMINIGLARLFQFWPFG